MLAEARAHLEDAGERTILFVDEIHRFNRAQQDVLLPDVEDGVVILIGATTQNPFFADQLAAAVSRSQIFTFEPLTREHIKTLIRRALADKERGLGNLNVTMTDEALAFLAEMCDGDARRALTALEIGVKSALAPSRRRTLTLPNGNMLTPLADRLHLTSRRTRSSARCIDFDPTGDAHYDLASAFIKSMRGSDPDAAVYWLARMLEVGEDPRFIARRLVIFAVEDVGNADPQALLRGDRGVGGGRVRRPAGVPAQPVAGGDATWRRPRSRTPRRWRSARRAKDVQEGRTLPVPKHLQRLALPRGEGAVRPRRRATSTPTTSRAAGWTRSTSRRTWSTTTRPTAATRRQIKERLDELRKRKASGGRQPPSGRRGGRGMTEEEWLRDNDSLSSRS